MKRLISRTEFPHEKVHLESRSIAASRETVSRMLKLLARPAAYRFTKQFHF